MTQNPQESNFDQDSHYREHLFGSPGMFHVFEQHPGFRDWFREMELGVKRENIRENIPNFKMWVESQYLKENPFIDSQHEIDFSECYFE
jgi:hypothetical protein